MVLKVEFDREDDGRWIAEVMNLRGVMAYGSTQAEALKNVKVLALQVLADMIEHGEAPADITTLEFTTAA